MTENLSLSRLIQIQKIKAKELGLDQVDDILMSPLNRYKYRVIFKNGHHIDYGARGYSDFLIHNDARKRYNFHQRFKKNPAYYNKNSSLWWAKSLLW